MSRYQQSSRHEASLHSLLWLQINALQSTTVRSVRTLHIYITCTCNAAKSCMAADPAARCLSRKPPVSRSCHCFGRILPALVDQALLHSATSSCQLSARLQGVIRARVTSWNNACSMYCTSMLQADQLGSDNVPKPCIPCHTQLHQPYGFLLLGAHKMCMQEGKAPT